METIKTHAFKIQIGSAIGAVLFIVYAVWWASGIQTQMINSIEDCKEQVMTNKDHIVALEEKAIGTDLVLVEVRTKLANIEALLNDIKFKLN